MPKTILFLCTANSCRSQMAEGLGRSLAPPGITVLSAGTAPAGVHPQAVAAMDRAGIDIRAQSSKALSGFRLEEIDLVITLCGSADEACPVLPRNVTRIHWPLPDPARAGGTPAAVAATFDEVRDELRRRIVDLFRVVRGEAPVELLERRRVYDAGKIVKLDRERLRLPNGAIADLEIIHHPGASAIVPLLPDGSVVLIRQYRHAANGYIIEVPAGKLDPGEAPDHCAARECEEESGYRAGLLFGLGFIYTTPGFTDEVIHLFAATRLERVPQRLETDEVIEVLTLPLARAVDMVMTNEIRDSKTACALVRADAALRAGRLSLGS